MFPPAAGIVASEACQRGHASILRLMRIKRSRSPGEGGSFFMAE